MSNILDAISNIIESQSVQVNPITFGRNRANNAGIGLENYIKDAFSNALNVTDINTKNLLHNRVFSYEGSSTRPPDLMIRGGDAIEVKKTESVLSDLQLNSSHPKAILFANSPLINSYCRTCEAWEEKDIIYSVGNIRSQSNTLHSLWFVYGSIYAAEESVYTELKNTITESISNTPDVNFSETAELGRVNYVDPLRITNMRIRGMWLIQPPARVYDYIYNYNDQLNFQLIAIIPSEKYRSFPETSRIRLENITNTSHNLNIVDVNVRNPNNPVNLIECKLITYIN